MSDIDLIKKAKHDLETRGIGAYTAAPPLWRLMWRAGIAVPPPPFIGFVPLALLSSVLFAVCWGLLMWALLWARDGTPVPVMVGGALFAGVLFGVSMALYMRHLARKHGLPDWASYRRQRAE